MRGPTLRAVFGTACSQVRWHEPPITSRSPPPSSWRSVAPAPLGRSSSRRGAPSETIATTVSSVDAASDRVAVPGDAVAPVAVQAEARGRERLTELLAVVLGERLPGLLEHGVGKGLALGVEAEQPRDVDHAVVHRSPFGPPGHDPEQPVEERVRPGDPPLPDIDPGAAIELRSLDRGAERTGAGGVREIEERGLQHDHALPSVHPRRTGVRFRACSGARVAQGLVRGQNLAVVPELTCPGRRRRGCVQGPRRALRPSRDRPAGLPTPPGSGTGLAAGPISVEEADSDRRRIRLPARPPSCPGAWADERARARAACHGRADDRSSWSGVRWAHAGAPARQQEGLPDRPTGGDVPRFGHGGLGGGARQHALPRGCGPGVRGGPLREPLGEDGHAARSRRRPGPDRLALRRRCRRARGAPAARRGPPHQGRADHPQRDLDRRDEQRRRRPRGARPCGAPGAAFRRRRLVAGVDRLPP